ncbi:MAG: DUF1961 family protein [Bacteroidota bacterium]
MKAIYFSLALCLAVMSLSCQSNSHASELPWTKGKLLFEDDGTQDWQANWMLDGQRSQVINSEQGMELIAGPEAKNDTCHSVLWTQQSFEGNICIEYDYTRTDTATRYVNIIYFHTTGEGSEEYPSDIALWNDKRVVPHMRTYFHNMRTYHISYATSTPERDYIRLRRYNPELKRLKGTDIKEDHFETGLFQKDVSYHVQVFKFAEQVEMHIQNNSKQSDRLICKWDVSALPTYENGRIGLRHMYTRSARYQNFKVWSLK